MDSKIAAMLALLLVTFNVAAEETDTIQNIKEILVEAAPTTVPDLIRPSPLEGIYEVFYGTEVMYVSADGRYVFQGQMIDLIDGKKNLTREAANQARKVYLTKVLEQESISFGPENARYEVTIFTDIDCGYCRKLHNEIEQYAEQGITVNYLLFPRNGLDAGSAQSRSMSGAVLIARQRSPPLNKARHWSHSSAIIQSLLILRLAAKWVYLARPLS